MKPRILALSITMTTVLALLWFLSFSRVAFASETGEREHKFDISLFSFVKPLGMCALGSALVTFTTGRFRSKLGKRFLKVHRTFAWLTVGFALCHGVLVLVLF